MVRHLAVLSCLVWATSARAVDRPAVLLAAKVAYLEQEAVARADYLKAVDAEVARLKASGNEADALRLLQHRGAWLLGDITAEEYREFEAGDSEAGHLAAVDGYIAAHAECRETLAGAYESIIKEARFIKRDDEAANYEGELEFFQSGDYVPTAVELLKPKPFDVRRILLEPPTAAPLAATKIPDELHVEFREHNFCIAGIKRIDTIEYDGRQRGHFGKGVVLPSTRRGENRLHGYLMIGTDEREVSYNMIVVSKTQFTPALSLDDLELDTVYEWSADILGDDFRIEVRRDGNVVASTRAFGSQGSMLGFCATARYQDTQARMVIAVD